MSPPRRTRPKGRISKVQAGAAITTTGGLTATIAAFTGHSAATAALYAVLGIVGVIAVVFVLGFLGLVVFGGGVGASVTQEMTSPDGQITRMKKSFEVSALARDGPPGGSPGTSRAVQEDGCERSPAE